MRDAIDKCEAPAGCLEERKRVAPFCRHHWYRIPIEIRKEIEKADKILSTGFAPGIRDDYERNIELAKEALKTSMIGPHELSKCGSKKRKGCGKPIIWLKTKRDKYMPIEPASVEPTDSMYEYGKHVVHWETCPYADWFRKSRGPG